MIKKKPKHHYNLTTTQAAKIARQTMGELIYIEHVGGWCATGSIDAIKEGNEWRIDANSLHEYLQARVASKRLQWQIRHAQSLERYYPRPQKIYYNPGWDIKKLRRRADDTAAFLARLEQKRYGG